MQQGARGKPVQKQPARAMVWLSWKAGPPSCPYPSELPAKGCLPTSRLWSRHRPSLLLRSYHLPGSKFSSSKELNGSFSRSACLTSSGVPALIILQDLHSRLFAGPHCQGKQVPLNMMVMHGSHFQQSMIPMEMLLEMLNLKPEHNA